MNLFFNNQFYPVSTPLFLAANRAYRFGEGIFETMLWLNGRICFGTDHLQRLQNGMQLLGIQPPPHFTLAAVEDVVARLVQKNGHQQAARIRLSVTCGNGMLNQFDEWGFEWLVESFEINILPTRFSQTGLTTRLFTGARKNTDALSAFKTASHLVYALAARHAVNLKLNDCIILNTGGMVCDSSIANLFMIKGNEIITPSLSGGCIAGVFRKNLILKAPELGYSVTERDISPAELETAGELFLTNVIRGICSVGQFEDKQYESAATAAFAQKILPRLYNP